MTAAERERRLQLVAQLLASGHSRAVVLSTCSVKLGMRTRTTDDYIAAVRRQWADRSAEKAEEHRGRVLQRLDDLGIKLERHGRWSALVNLERLRADVLGAKRPVEVAVTASPDPIEAPMPEVVTKLTVLSSAIMRKALAGAAKGDPDCIAARDALARAATRLLDDLARASLDGSSSANGERTSHGSVLGNVTTSTIQ